MVVVNIPGTEISYFMEEHLKKQLDNIVIPSLTRKDKDCVVLVDGAEGAGKSTFAMQMAKYVDPTFSLEDVCFDDEEFKQAIFRKKKAGAVIYDEAFTGLSSRSALSKVTRMLVNLMMQMRQKNLFVIIVLPSFFQVDKYVALFRSNALFHVYQNKGRRGYYIFFNRKKKKMAYLLGQKTYDYNKVRVTRKAIGRFHGKCALGPEVEPVYKKKKEEALIRTNSEKVEPEGRMARERKLFLVNWYMFCKKHHKITQDKFVEILKQINVDIKRNTLSGFSSDLKEKGLIVDSL